MKGYSSAHPLFDRPTAAVEPVDPSVLPSDRTRLTGAAYRVLERLRQGPATNVELAEVGGMRFGGRLHDLRKAGVVWKREHIQGPIWGYVLIKCPVELE